MLNKKNQRPIEWVKNVTQLYAVYKRLTLDLETQKA